MFNTRSTYLHFMWAGITKHGQTGGIVPSQKFLITKMIAPVPENYQGQIIELGAGNGALTLRLAKQCPRARILTCEINPSLAYDNRCNLTQAGIDGRVEVVADSAENVLSETKRKGMEQADYIISGIPLGNLGREQVFVLLEMIHHALKPGGMYIQFQHSLFDRQKIQAKFSRMCIVPVFLNFPPAFIYYAER